MDYQDLTEILGQSKTGTTTAPSLNSIIEGIQSQYQAIPTMPVQSALYGANRYISGTPKFGAIDVVPEYGSLNQLIGPSFVPSAFDKSIYEKVDTKKLSDLISQIDPGSQFDYGGFADGFGGNIGSTTSSTTSSTGVSSGTGASTGIGGFSLGPSGVATPNTVSQPAATVLGMVMGAPLGLLASMNNMAANAAAASFNSAISDTMGVNANNTSPAAVSAAQAASGMTGTTGGNAANAAANAAAAAAAAGHSDAAIGAASQAAATAAMSGLSAAAQAQAASDAAASVDGGTTGPGSAAGIGVGSTTGINAMDAMSDAASAGIGGGTSGGVSGIGVGSAEGVNGMDAASDAASAGDGASAGGGGGGGSKIICTKLHELGMMPTNIYQADQAFGKKLVNESPETYYGYVRWAKHIVDLMSRDDLIGKIAIFCAYHIATPWSLAMAEEMGQPVKASWFGKFLMKRGLQFCKMVGHKAKETAIA